MFHNLQFFHTQISGSTHSISRFQSKVISINKYVHEKKEKKKREIISPQLDNHHPHFGPEFSITLDQAKYQLSKTISFRERHTGFESSGHKS